jgi:hypothetical protein
MFTLHFAQDMASELDRCIDMAPRKRKLWETTVFDGAQAKLFGGSSPAGSASEAALSASPSSVAPVSPLTEAPAAYAAPMASEAELAAPMASEAELAAQMASEAEFAAPMASEAELRMPSYLHLMWRQLRHHQLPRPRSHPARRRAGTSAHCLARLPQWASDRIRTHVKQSPWPK